MKWVLITIGLLPDAPFVSVSDYQTLQECFFTGERIQREYERTFFHDAKPDEHVVSFSCLPSSGVRPPTCGLDNLPPCQ